MLGILGVVIGLPSALPQAGSQAPLEGIGVIYLVGALAVCLAVFFICVFVRPKRESFTPVARTISVVAYVVVIVCIWSLAHSVGRYVLTVHVVDSSKQPIEGAVVEYRSFALGEGIGKLDTLSEGKTNTSASGVFKIQSNHAHRLDVAILKGGYKRATLQFEAAGRRYPQQLDPRGVNVEPPLGATPSGRTWLMPKEGDINLTAILQQE